MLATCPLNQAELSSTQVELYNFEALTQIYVYGHTSCSDGKVPGSGIPLGARPRGATVEH